MNTGMRRILLKLTGEIFFKQGTTVLTDSGVRSIARQIRSLRSDNYIFGIVMGGGNFFRGTLCGAQLHIQPSVSHYVGMLATVMNGLLLKDIFEQEGIPVTLLSALQCPDVAHPLSQYAITRALQKEECIVFAGGMATPFFSTDTTAVIRALQIQAHMVWKATKVHGIFTKDPVLYADAEYISTLSYQQALERNIAVMDRTALLLAEQHKLPMRVFSIWSENSICEAAQNAAFGTLLY